GTLSGNPLSVAAGIATLRNATGQVYSTIDRASSHLRKEVGAALDAEGVQHSIQTAGNIFSVAFGTGENGVRNYEEVKASESYRYTAFFHSMLDSGVYMAPSPFEAWFLSAAHDDAAMDRIVSALPAAARAAASSERPR
ncbi:MAG: aspartate aminotransferase family protein, partial [Kocuria sp.]|nr:aspartate aminotransferase family protein [Kocuria sp.]